MKMCDCGTSMEIVKFAYEYKFECPNCNNVEDINEDDLEEGELYNEKYV